MNSRTIRWLVLGVTVLGCLFIVVGSRRVPPSEKRTPMAEPKPPAYAEPAVAVVHGLTIDALDAKVRRMEEQTKQLQSLREQRALEEKEKERKLNLNYSREVAGAIVGQWMAGFQLTDAQRGPILSLFERWLTEDVVREEYRRLDRATFEAREAELRSLLTPEQQLARHAAVKEQIQDVWNSLSNSVFCIQQDQDPGFLMMGPPWTPASRAAYAQLQKQLEQLQLVTVDQGGSATPAFHPDLLGDCPPIADTVLLADAHDLGLLGLWQKAESRARSLLTTAQQEKYDKLVPTTENPVYHHGY